MLDLDWESEKSYVFVNPRLPESQRESLAVPLEKESNNGHIYLTTSGTRSLKWVALSKQAFLTSAAAVNQHLEASPKDIWINALPHYHVGGLSIYARAFLAKSFVYRYDLRWEAAKWCAYLDEKKGSITSLVPAQVWDLVEKGIPAPKCVRVVLVGGQKLPLEIYEKARGLGWPLMPTYGLTECCSQVATADLESPELKLLSHIEVKTSVDHRLSIKSDSLLTGYLKPQFEDPKVEGWFETEDRVRVEAGYLTPSGRVTDLIKIKGEFVNLFELQTLLDTLKGRFKISAETAIVPLEDERNGYNLHLFHSPYNVLPLIETFNKSVIPEARITLHTELKELPKTAIGKIAYEQLLRR